MANLHLINELCEMANMTKVELSKRAGVSQQAIYKAMTNGQAKIATIEAIAEVFKISPAAFWDPMPDTDKDRKILVLEGEVSRLEKKIESMLKLQEHRKSGTK